jgi:hypothetical protein
MFTLLYFWNQHSFYKTHATALPLLTYFLSFLSLHGNNDVTTEDSECCIRVVNTPASYSGGP